MKGLLLKDIMLQKKQIIIAAAAAAGIAGFVILMILSVYYGNFRKVFLDQGWLEEQNIKRFLLLLSFAMAALCGYLATLSLNCFRYDEKADYGKISASLPVTAKDRIVARFGIYGMYLGSMIVLNLILQPIIYIVAKQPFGLDAVLSIGAGFTCYTILALICIPLMYRFGGNIQVLVNTVITIGACIILIQMIYYAADHNISADWIMYYIKTGRNILAVIFPVLLTVGIPLSAGISIRIQARRRNVLW